MHAKSHKRRVGSNGSHAPRGRRVVVVHDAVRGRLRLRIARLDGSIALKQRLESELPAAAGVRTVSASTLSCTALIVFDPDRSSRAVVRAVERLVDGAKPHQRPSVRTPTEPGVAWHLKPAARVLQQIGATIRGLSSDAARRRLASNGPNLLPPAQQRSQMEILISQFQSLPVALLSGAAVLSLLSGGFADAAVILGVVGLNAAIGFASESRTERTISGLLGGGQSQALVVRDGVPCTAPVTALVPGDMLALQPGLVVGADARVVKSDDLMISEATLTGESFPVSKISRPLNGRLVPLADRANMVYRGTTVTGGNGLAVVIATGRNTEVGHIQELVATSAPPLTPMQRQLDELGRQLVLLSVGLCALTFVVGLARGRALLPMLQTAISLAVAAVPEGLPTLATTTLARGVEDMRRRKVLVRRLGAVETLASTQVLCVDKTGTLTANRMSVVAAVSPALSWQLGDNAGAAANGGALPANSRDALAHLLAVSALCNDCEADGTDSQSGGNVSTEAALVRAALDADIDVAALRREMPRLHTSYRSERRHIMATVHRRPDGERITAIKGSPEQVLAASGWYEVDGRRLPLTAEVRAAIEAENQKMAASGLRVLGIAEAERHGGDGADRATDRRATWLGLVGMTDRVRSGVRDLMATLQGAGIQTIMLTGDQATTARSVATLLGLGNGRPIHVADTAELESLAGARLSELAQQAHVFARVSPADKLHILKALQHNGWVVAMTGDGVNDSPALKAADIGIAMGSGSDAAREVADVILQSDDLNAISSAVARGRTTYSNIRRAVHYLLASNLSEIIHTFGGAAAGGGPMLTPSQLLWINLLTDVLPAIGLGLEPPPPDVLRQPPRNPAAPIVERLELVEIAREGAIISAGAAGSLAYGLLRYGPGGHANTLSFASLVTAQLLHAITCRSRHHGLFSGERLPANPTLTLALAAAFALQGAALFVPPLRGLLGLTPIGLSDALVAGLGGVLPFFANEALKRWPAREVRSEQSRDQPRGRAFEELLEHERHRGFGDTLAGAVATQGALSLRTRRHSHIHVGDRADLGGERRHVEPGGVVADRQAAGQSVGYGRRNARRG